MRNLKRALSLVMAMALIVGMMVVSASAVSKDFTDYDEIEHKEAVEVMTALNVIDGKEDGSYYDPTGTLTRAEMAKVVAYVMNGGVEPNIGTKVVPTYSDIDNHWAEAYIEYCTSMGIIAGDGAGRFNPEGTLTAEQCAKMFLTAMGYDANVFGFTGNDWAMNVGRYANEAGLYEDLGDVAVSQPISRDDAAQMAYNAIQATTMRRQWNQDMQTGEITEVYQLYDGHTLFTDRFNGTMYEGILLGTGRYNIANVGDTGNNGDSTTGRFSFLRLKTNDGELYTPTDNEATVVRMNYADDLTDLVGQRIKVVAGQSGSIYGIFPMDGENTVIEAVYGDVTTVDAGAIEIDGTEYAISDNAQVEVGETAYALSNYFPTTAVKSAAPVKAISYDGDDEIDLVLVTPISNAVKVSYVSDTTFTAGVSYTKADVIYPEDLAKDDIVISYKNYYQDKDQFEVLETVTGEITASRGTPSYTEVQVDGTWYPVAATNGTISSAINISDSNALERNSSYTLAVYNGYAMWSELEEAGSRDIALVIGVAGAPNASGSWETRLLLADGTVITEPAVDVTKASNSATASSAAPTAVSTNIADSSTGYYEYNKSLVTYEVNDDGVYELTAIVVDRGTTNDNTNLAGYDAMAAIDTNGFDKDSKDLDVKSGGTTKVDEDAVVFVAYNDNGAKYDVLTGAELNNLTGDFGSSGVYLYNTSGLQAAEVVLLMDTSAMLPGVSASKNIGYVLTNPYTQTSGSTNYQVFDLWTDEGLMEDVRLNTSTATVARGDFISFDLDADNRAVNVVVAGDPVAIVGYSENSGAIRLANSTVAAYNTLLSLADTTKIIFVNSATHEYIEGGEVSLAVSPATGVYYSNAKVLTNAGTNGVANDADDEVEFICVDVANEQWDGATVTAISGAVTSTTIRALNDGMYTVDNASGLTDTSSTDHTAANLRIFKFTGQGVSESFTLTITDSSDVARYTEVSGTFNDTNGHYFVMDITGYYNSADNSTNTYNFSTNHGTYTWEISGSVSGVVASGSFVTE